MTDLSVRLRLPVFQAGWVWLAGAGPGDPALASLATVNGLQQADIVVYDALVSPELLELARPEAQLEFAGKRGGKPSPKQVDISARLVAAARGGARVLRLKGGDPFIFGRGGEEALALVANHIPFRVIPGITAGIGGLAYAGIPLTHRSTNSAVAFITGHGVTGDIPDNLDWQALATGMPVLVFYMALKHLPVIRQKLLSAGRPADDLVALISSASLANQTVVETTLGNCLEAAAAVAPPAVIAMGPVVGLRASMDWLGALAGRVLTLPPELKNRATGHG